MISHNTTYTFFLRSIWLTFIQNSINYHYDFVGSFPSPIDFIMFQHYHEYGGFTFQNQINTSFCLSWDN